jgi:hypothetical protein
VGKEGMQMTCIQKATKGYNKMTNKKKEMYSKEYIKGFRHGANWFRIYSFIDRYDVDFDINEFKEDLNEAIKSLRKGR